MKRHFGKAWLFSIFLISEGIFTVVCQIHFPTGGQVTQGHLPEPETCKGGAVYCGGELSKYPADAIKAIIDQTVELKKSRDSIEHFFQPLSTQRPPFVVTDRDEASDELELACPTRTELIPRFSRAKNVKGSWVYLVEGDPDQRQEVEVTICENAGSPCINDLDSPHGVGTTLCKQVYRTQKLLALDERKEIVIDTFDLPSACICNFKDVSFGFRSGSAVGGGGGSLPEEPECEPAAEESAVRSTLKDDERMSLAEPSEETTTMVPEPCKVDERVGDAARNICLNTTEHKYPHQLVDSLLRQHDTLRSPPAFERLFSKPCQRPKPDVAFRIGFSVDETPLCSYYQRYLFPKVARNVNGQWRYIINTKEYRQGVTVEVCNSGAEDAPCRYGGAEGNIPEATVCKQRYAKHNMLTITPSMGITYDTFLIPSACVCHIKDSSFFNYEYY